MKEVRIHIFATVAFCIYLAAIGALCFMHGDDLPSVRETLFGIPTDKIAHFLMFCPFIPLSFMTFSRGRHPIGRDIILLTFLIFIGGATAYGTELIQEELSYRSYDIKDMKADIIGLSAGYVATLIWIIIKHLTNKR